MANKSPSLGYPHFPYLLPLFLFWKTENVTNMGFWLLAEPQSPFGRPGTTGAYTKMEWAFLYLSGPFRTPQTSPNLQVYRQKFSESGHFSSVMQVPGRRGVDCSGFLWVLSHRRS